MLYALFTPMTGMVGGSLIGLSAGTLLLFNGDILGASGLLSTTGLDLKKALTDPSQYWKLVLLSSFTLTASLLFGPEYSRDTRMLDPSDDVPIPSALAYSLAGLLVGFGTKLGNGCTTGHGVCGMARLSKRSYVSVATFMAAGFATQLALCPTASWAERSWFLRTETVQEPDPGIGALLVVLPLCLATLVAPRLAKKKEKTDQKVDGMTKKAIPAAVAGFLFASGLAISQMVVQSKLFGFLNFCGIPTGEWDPTLAAVLGMAVPASMLTYQFVEGFGFIKNSKALKQPICASKFSVPTNTVIDTDLILGAAVFGVGWAMGCLCPGPAIFSAAIGNKQILFNWMPSFFVGSYAALKYKDSRKL